MEFPLVLQGEEVRTGYIRCVNVRLLFSPGSIPTEVAPGYESDPFRDINSQRDCAWRLTGFKFVIKTAYSH